MMTAAWPALTASAYSTAYQPPTRSGTAQVFVVAAGADQDLPWDRLIDGLRAARRLGDDWDGQGAVAPPPALVDAAIGLARSLRASGYRPADFAIPGVNGTIVFEWHDPAEYAEIEVTAPDRAVRRVIDRRSKRARATDLRLGC